MKMRTIGVVIVGLVVLLCTLFVPARAEDGACLLGIQTAIHSNGSRVVVGDRPVDARSLPFIEDDRTQILLQFSGKTPAVWTANEIERGWRFDLSECRNMVTVSRLHVGHDPVEMIKVVEHDGDLSVVVLLSAPARADVELLEGILRISLEKTGSVFSDHGAIAPIPSEKLMAALPGLEGVRAGRRGSVVELRLKLSKPPLDFKTVRATKQMLIDFPGYRNNSGQPVFAIEDPLLELVRVVEGTDGIRIIACLSTAFKSKVYQEDSSIVAMFELAAPPGPEEKKTKSSFKKTEYSVPLGRVTGFREVAAVEESDSGDVERLKALAARVRAEISGTEDSVPAVVPPEVPVLPVSVNTLKDIELVKVTGAEELILLTEKPPAYDITWQDNLQMTLHLKGISAVLDEGVRLFYGDFLKLVRVTAGDDEVALVMSFSRPSKVEVRPEGRYLVAKVIEREDGDEFYSGTSSAKLMVQKAVEALRSASDEERKKAAAAVPEIPALPQGEPVRGEFTEPALDIEPVSAVSLEPEDVPSVNAIKDIKVTEENGRGVIVMTMSKQTDFKSVTLPKQLILTFPETVPGEGPATRLLEKDLLRFIRTYQRDGGLGVIAKFSRPVTNDVHKDGSRVVVSYHEEGTTAYAPEGIEAIQPLDSVPEPVSKAPQTPVAIPDEVIARIADIKERFKAVTKEMVQKKTVGSMEPSEAGEKAIAQTETVGAEEPSEAGEKAIAQTEIVGAEELSEAGEITSGQPVGVPSVFSSEETLPEELIPEELVLEETPVEAAVDGEPVPETDELPIDLSMIPTIPEPPAAVADKEPVPVPLEELISPVPEEMTLESAAEPQPAEAVSVADDVVSGEPVEVVPEGEPGVLTDIKVLERPDGGPRVLVCVGGKPEFKVVHTPRQIIVDMPGVTQGMKKDVVLVGRWGIKLVRMVPVISGTRMIIALQEHMALEEKALTAEGIAFDFPGPELSLEDKLRAEAESIMGEDLAAEGEIGEDVEAIPVDKPAVLGEVVEIPEELEEVEYFPPVEDDLEPETVTPPASAEPVVIKDDTTGIMVTVSDEPASGKTKVEDLLSVIDALSETDIPSEVGLTEEAPESGEESLEELTARARLIIERMRADRKRGKTTGPGEGEAAAMPKGKALIDIKVVELKGHSQVVLELNEPATHHIVKTPRQIIINLEDVQNVIRDHTKLVFKEPVKVIRTNPFDDDLRVIVVLTRPVRSTLYQRKASLVLDLVTEEAPKPLVETTPSPEPAPPEPGFEPVRPVAGVEAGLTGLEVPAAGTTLTGFRSVTGDRGVVESDVLEDDYVPTAGIQRALSIARQREKAYQLYVAGEAAAERGDWEESVGSFKEALELTPGDLTVIRALNTAVPRARVIDLHRRGRDYQKNAEIYKAIWAFKEGLKIDPENVQLKYALNEAEGEERVLLHLQQGKDYYLRKLYEKAVPEFKEAVENDYNNAAAHHYLGLCYIGLKWFKAAVAELETALKLAPYDKDIRVAVEEARQREKIQEFYRLGQTHEKNQQWDLAVKYYEDALSIERHLESGQDDVSDRFLKEGLRHFNGRQYQKATASFREVLKLSPQNLKANYWLGRTLMITGQIARAVAAFKRVVELDPTNSISVESLMALSGEDTVALKDLGIED